MMPVLVLNISLFITSTEWGPSINIQNCRVFFQIQREAHAEEIPCRWRQHFAQFRSRDSTSSSWKLPNPCCRGGAAIHESSVVVESENSIRKMTPFPALAAFKSFFFCCSAAEKEKKEKALGSFMLSVSSALWPDGALAECVEREGRKVTARSGPAVFRCALLSVLSMFRGFLSSLFSCV